VKPVATKKKAAKRKPDGVRPEGSRLVVIELPKAMPGGKTTPGHPLLWLMDFKMKDRTKSDLAREMGIRPQSLYKWERYCKTDRNFPLPGLRAAQIAKFFRVKPALLRPDLFGA
jgi:DNA-binding XRE family transcriptional regulator